MNVAIDLSRQKQELSCPTYYSKHIGIASLLILERSVPIQKQCPAKTFPVVAVQEQHHQVYRQIWTYVVKNVI